MKNKEDEMYLSYNPLAENHTLALQKTKINLTIEKIRNIRKNKKNEFFDYESVEFNKNNELTLKLINWYIIQIIKNYKLCIICARDINTKKKYYFSFEFLQHFFILEEEKDEIKDFLNLGLKEEFNISKIKKKEFTILELYNFFKLLDIKNIYDKINDKNLVKKTLYLIKTNIKILESVSILDNGFNGSHQLKPFLILNNILIDGIYKINNITLKRNKLNGIYFIEDKLINSVFNNPQDIIIDSIENIISFDIENIVSKKNGVIFSKFNIMPMIAFTIKYLSKIYSFSFVNIDYMVSDLISRYKKDLFNTDNLENIYDNVLKKEKSSKYKKYYNLYDERIYDKKFTKNSIILSYVIFEDMEYFINYLIMNNIKIIYTSEYDMILFLKQIIENDLFDIICHYNGNNYDYAMINIRKKYIENLLNMIPNNLTFKKFFDLEIIMREEISHKKTFRCTRIIFDLPIKNFDLMILSKMQLERELENISLNEVSKFYFSNTGMVKKYNTIYQYKITFDDIKDDIRKYSLDNLFKMVNYCEINNIVFKIILYGNEDNQNYIIIETLQQDKSSFLNFNTNVNVSIIKDDINIMDNEVYKLENILTTVKYCMTDSALPCFLLNIMNYFHLSSVETTICKMSQCQTLQYQNNTKLRGPLLEICLKNNIFLTKNKMITKSNNKKGGFVFKPKEVFNKDTIAILDFKSLYPYLMKVFNISPDTFVSSFILKDKFEHKILRSYIKNNPKLFDSFIVVDIEEKFTFNLFQKNKNGVLGLLVKNFLEEREKAKENEKKSDNYINKYYYSILGNYLKVMANSIYGLTGVNFESIYLSTEVAESICALGRNFIKNTFEMINNIKIVNNEFVIIDKNLFNIYRNEPMTLFESTILKNHKLYNKEYKIESIYGDTDSIMVKIVSNERHIKDEIIIGNALVELINILVDGKLEIKLESMMLCSFIKKKNYASYSISDIDLNKIINISNDDLLKKKIVTIKGISSTKRGVCIEHRKTVFEFIKYLLDILLKEKYDKQTFKEFLNKKIIYLSRKIYQEWIDKEKNNLIELRNFLIFISYKKSKIETNTTNILVDEYNNKEGITEFITEGNKFPYFHYINDESLNNNIEVYLKSIKINETKMIYDRKLFNLQKNKINYPIYLYKIVKSLLGLFNDSNIDKDSIRITCEIIKLDTK